MPRIWFNADGKLSPTKPVVHGTDETRLSEDMAAGSTSALWYPGVGSCATFTVVTASKIAGTHVSMVTTKDVLKKLFAHVLAEAGGPLTALYLSGNSKVWAENDSPMGKTPADFVKFARAELGKYKGNAYLADTKDLVTKDKPHACIRATFTGTAGAVIETMAQASGIVPSATELGGLKVVPPAKLVAIK